MNNALFVMKYQTWITVVFVVKQVLITNNDDNIPKNYFKFKKFWRQWWGAMDCRQHDFSSELNKITENIDNCRERGRIKYHVGGRYYSSHKVAFTISEVTNRNPWSVPQV